MNVDVPPTLSDFMRSDHPSRLVVGPFGSGKSSVCIAELLRRSQEQALDPPSADKRKKRKRRTRWAVIRNTYPELRDTTRKTFDEWIWRFTDGQPDRIGEWREQEFTFRMRFNDVESDVLFRSLDRPKDVKKLLSMELTGAYINEWREIAKENYEGLTGRIGRYPAMVDGGPTWRGIWGDTNPWHPTHWVPQTLKKHPGSIRVFRQPGGRAASAENVQNLEPGYYERLCIGKDQEWIDVYVDGLDAAAPPGSVYGRLIAALRSRGAVCTFKHGLDEVFTTWDLGIADSLAIWWWRLNDQGGVDLIDWYENAGEPLSHYLDVVKAKPYRYILHFLPHDAKARTLQTGKSTLEQVQLGLGAGKVVTLPALDIDDGIAAARWLIEQQTTRFHERCDEVPKHRDFSGIGMLAEYKFVWDEVNKVFSRIPLHNFASHTADAFRYVAMAVKHGGLVAPPKVIIPDAPFARDPGSYTFHERAQATIRRSNRRTHL